MKLLLYETPVASLQVKKVSHIFQQVHNSMSRRIYLCNEVESRHFETLLYFLLICYKNNKNTDVFYIQEGNNFLSMKNCSPQCLPQPP